MTKQATAGRTWKYSVYKISRGSNGRYFRYPAAATFHSETEAAQYAREFAAQQRGVAGSKIVAARRRGDKTIVEINTQDGKEFSYSA